MAGAYRPGTHEANLRLAPRIRWPIDGANSAPTRPSDDPGLDVGPADPTGPACTQTVSGEAVSPGTGPIPRPGRRSCSWCVAQVLAITGVCRPALASPGAGLSDRSAPRSLPAPILAFGLPNSPEATLGRRAVPFGSRNGPLASARGKTGRGCPWWDSPQIGAGAAPRRLFRRLAPTNPITRFISVLRRFPVRRVRAPGRARLRLLGRCPLPLVREIRRFLCGAL